MGSRLLCSILLLVSLAATAPAATLVVDATSGPYYSIPAAVAAAAPGDEILVSPGVWDDGVITIGCDLTLTGQSGSGATFIDGRGAARGIHVTGGATATITGFTIRDTYASDGAGIHVDFASVATLRGCALIGNNASYVGGAGYVRHAGSQLSFVACAFIDNYAPLNAGGVGISLGSRCEFDACYFEGNRSISMAGAIANFANSPVSVTNSFFVRNSGGECGAIRIYDAPAEIVGNTFHDNNSGEGTLYLNTSYRVLITNNIFSHDSGFGIGGGADKLYPSCNLYDGNVRGPSQAHALTPTEVDGPALFCAPEAGIFALCTNSPALAANNVCGLMGASDETCGACGPVAVEDQAWGTVKSMFR